MNTKKKYYTSGQQTLLVQGQAETRHANHDVNRGKQRSPGWEGFSIRLFQVDKSGPMHHKVTWLPDLVLTILNKLVGGPIFQSWNGQQERFQVTPLIPVRKWRVGCSDARHATKATTSSTKPLMTCLRNVPSGSWSYPHGCECFWPTLAEAGSGDMLWNKPVRLLE